MNLISYTLYGNDIRYTEPLIYNSKRLNMFYKGWTLRVYHDNTVSNSTLIILTKNGVQLINIQETNFSYFAPKFWRFLPVFEKNIKTLIVRDSDSIFTDREVLLVNEWCNSDTSFHILRDHYLHISPILAGMFGIKSQLFPLFSEQLLHQKKIVCSTIYNADQTFLADFIYDKICKNCLVHTSHFTFFGEEFIRIKKSSDASNFIGSVFIDKEMNSGDSLYHYEFMIGIPFWIAKVLRYKIRPVLYLSFMFNKLIQFFNGERFKNK